MQRGIDDAAGEERLRVGVHRRLQLNALVIGRRFVDLRTFDVCINERGSQRLGNRHGHSIGFRICDRRGHGKTDEVLRVKSRADHFRSHLNCQIARVAAISNALERHADRHDLDRRTRRCRVINMPPRLRMTALYAVSQSNNGRVVNTCNLSEDWVGYSTRYGDAAGDFSPLGGLTVAEVLAIGEVLGLPEDLVHKTPSDGLCGKSDEDNLGFTYAVLDKYIRTGVCEDAAVKALIDRKHVMNLFKLKPIPHFEPDV